MPDTPQPVTHLPDAAERSRNRIVMVMIAIVSFAAASGLVIQFGASVPLAAVIGAVAWSLLLSVHFQVRGQSEIARLRSEIAWLNAGGAKLASDSPLASPSLSPNLSPNLSMDEFDRPGQSAPIQRRGLADGAQNLPKAPSFNQARQPSATHVGSRATPSLGNTQSVLVRPGPSLPGDIGSRQPALSQSPGLPSSSMTTGRQTPAARQQANTGAIEDWASRLQKVSLDSEPDRAMRDGRSGSAPTIDAELELVQRKIKALADGVNGTSPPGVGLDQAMLPSAIEQSIGQLNAAAQVMRERQPAEVSPPSLNTSAGFHIPASAETLASSTPVVAEHRPAVGLAVPPPIAAPGSRSPSDSRTVAIAEAIQAGRMDVAVSPIIGLGDQAVSHYEVVVRLLAPNGEAIAGQEPALSSAGPDMLALFDSARVSRSARFAQMLESNGRKGSVLSGVDGRSLTDVGFLNVFARLFEERRTLSGQIVLTFAQGDVERFSDAAWRSLADMQSFGFRFALDKVTHLAMDFDTLAQKGFLLVKLPSQAFVDGIPAGSGTIPANDICRHLAGAGLMIVAEAIDNEALRARIFGFGVLHGQGALFGGPRPLPMDAPARGRVAAA